MQGYFKTKNVTLAYKWRGEKTTHTSTHTEEQLALCLYLLTDEQVQFITATSVIIFTKAANNPDIKFNMNMRVVPNGQMALKFPFKKDSQNLLIYTNVLK